MRKLQMNSVAAIGKNAFSGCAKLSLIEFHGNSNEWYAVAKNIKFDSPRVIVKCWDRVIAYNDGKISSASMDVYYLVSTDIEIAILEKNVKNNLFGDALVCYIGRLQSCYLLVHPKLRKKSIT